MEKLKQLIQSITNGQGKNIFLSLLFKGLAVFINFYIFRLGVIHLGNSNMGVWLTISSITSWITFFDFGIGNGLRNKLTEALTKNDKTLAQQIVSTAYLLSSFISICFLILFLVLTLTLNWNSILNTTLIDKNVLLFIVIISLGSIAIRLSTDLILSVTNAVDKAFLSAFITFCSNVVILILLNYFIYKNSIYIIQFATIVSIIPIIVAIFSSVLFYSKTQSYLKPKIKSYNKNLVKGFLKIGSSFFIIQLMYILIFTTDNLIVANLFEPNDVTVYNTAYKYFNIITFLFSIVITPYWTSITQANASNNNSLIKSIMSTLNKFWMFSIGAVIIMSLLANIVYFYWTNDKVQVPLIFTITMAVYVIIGGWNSVYATYLNALGKLQLQKYFSIITGIINIPLCYLFAVTCNFGITGVALATIACLLPGAVLAYLQYKYLSKNMAKGIWAK